MGGGVKMILLFIIVIDCFYVFVGIRLGLRNFLLKLVVKICVVILRIKLIMKCKFGFFFCVVKI